MFAEAYRFIGWLKNFISDRNCATQNLIDSYTAVTLARRAPSALRSSLNSRWQELERKPSTKSFLHDADEILGREHRAGLYRVYLKLAPHNCTQLHQPSELLQGWFDSVEHGLLIYELNERASFRKNGSRVSRNSIVSYSDRNRNWHVGIVVSIFAGCRPSAPYVVGCSVCSLQTIHPSRIHFSHGEIGALASLVLVDNVGPPSTYTFACSTTLRHKYVKVLDDTAPEQR